MHLKQVKHIQHRVFIRITAIINNQYYLILIHIHSGIHDNISNTVMQNMIKA
jgi:hypothetical protein